MKALTQDWKISIEVSQGRISLGMLPLSIDAEALEVSQKTGVVHTKLMPPVNNILTARRHQVLPLPFIGWVLDLGWMANLRTRRQARSGACQAEATSIS